MLVIVVDHFQLQGQHAIVLSQLVGVAEGDGYYQVTGVAGAGDDVKYGEPVPGMEPL